MRNVYVKELCVLLHKLKITQHDIATALQVERSTVGAWSGGKRPLPARHVAAFRALVREVLGQAEKQAWIGYRETGTHFLDTSNTVSRLDLMVRTQLRRWECEVYLRSGRLDRDKGRILQSLAFVARTSGQSPTADDDAHLRFLANDLVRILRIKTYITDGVDEVDGRHLRGVEGGSLQEAFAQVWDRAVAQQDTPIGEEDETTA